MEYLFPVRTSEQAHTLLIETVARCAEISQQMQHLEVSADLHGIDGNAAIHNATALLIDALKRATEDTETLNKYITNTF